MVNGNKFFILIFLFGILCLFDSNSIIFGQDMRDLSFIINNNDITKKPDKKPMIHTQKETSEIKLMFTEIIHTYQLFISSQDRNSCIFTVSCSRFAQDAIKKYGAVYGIFMISDRLQRCNALGMKFYQTDTENELVVDFPISSYFIGKK